MKKKLNILCILTLVILFSSVASDIVESSSIFAHDFMTGYKTGSYSANKKWDGKTSAEADSLASLQYPESKDIEQRSYVYLMPTSFVQHTSITNEKTGKPVHMWVCEAMVSAPKSTLNNVLTGILGMLSFILGVWAFILFIKLIYRLNKTNDVFTWEQVHKLRRLGLLLIAYAVLSSLMSVLEVSGSASVVSFSGYTFDYFGCFHYVPLLLGVIALVVAETFSVGLKLREEQELTI
jgi:hypothetical protein